MGQGHTPPTLSLEAEAEGTLFIRDSETKAMRCCALGQGDSMWPVVKGRDRASREALAC